MKICTSFRLRILLMTALPLSYYPITAIRRLALVFFRAMHDTIRFVLPLLLSGSGGFFAFFSTGQNLFRTTLDFKSKSRVHLLAQTLLNKPPECTRRKLHPLFNLRPEPFLLRTCAKKGGVKYKKKPVSLSEFPISSLALCLATGSKLFCCYFKMFFHI